MKKVILSITVLISAAMISCSDSKEQSNEEQQEVKITPTVEIIADPLCDCVDKILAITKTMDATPEEEKMKVMGDMLASMDQILKECEPIFEKIDADLEGLSDADKKIKEDEMKDACPALKELDELQNK